MGRDSQTVLLEGRSDRSSGVGNKKKMFDREIDILCEVGMIDKL